LEPRQRRPLLTDLHVAGRPALRLSLGISAVGTRHTIDGGET
jgi:hypothetical protein